MKKAKTRKSSGSVAALSRTIRAEIAELPGVKASPRSFRIGQKIFVRFTEKPNHVLLEFTLSSDEAAHATRHAFVQPMEFGGMGRHGWVEVAATRASQLPVIRRLIGLSYALYRQP